eukprot:gnl/MRDRNA2_/MRDRNA2_97091_c0_seq1.p1 gnl/MRDRNA2_/MRDRNA2_97091_c0~~gnl/MRDRNA2_/MRDRNA2_97091_c0_seq1.p1  ORF type:complete len:168 (-),score=21.53 gnl/MRDRNA2_/MRDRNA2_97091_c0_seq1:74-577(-)
MKYSALVVLSCFAGTISGSFNRKDVWKPEPCEELKPGETCRQLYQHPQGSTFVGTCPIDTIANPDGCAAYAEDKPDAEHCPQIKCPKALGVTMKLVCGGGCCPTCWAPDHIVAMDRHTAMEGSPYGAAAHPKAPTTCEGVKCFKPVCPAGKEIGHVEGACCYSCVAR